MATGIEDKVALVTGAAQGIGEAVVTALAELGAVVAATDCRLAPLEAVVARLVEKGCRVASYELDVTDRRAVEAVLDRAEGELGPVALLVNVAGVLRTGPLTALADADWETVLGVNTGGVLNVTRAVTRRMVPRGAGAVVTVGSNAALVPRMSMGAYGASKAAATALTKTFGLELAQYGIRCNVVSPGSTDTAMLRSMWSTDGDADTTLRGSLAHYRVGIPLQRVAQPADVAEAVLFLLSDHARHVTMQELVVDGGAALGA